MVNSDLLGWFSEDETVECSACGERACVTLPNAASSFCLHCSAVWLQGERLDVDGSAYPRRPLGNDPLIETLTHSDAEDQPMRSQLLVMASLLMVFGAVPMIGVIVRMSVPPERRCSSLSLN